MRGASRAIENELRRFGYVHVAGVDEVGRGCLAGPVVAGAVVLQADRYVTGVADSKLLTAEHREALSCASSAPRCRGTWPSSSLTRSIGSTSTGRRSGRWSRPSWLSSRSRGLCSWTDSAFPNIVMPQRPVVGGDRRSTAIAAASILAKVTRDRLMMELHARDPRYGFDRHKGYATREHLAAVDRFGYSAVHRRTFRPPSLFDTIRD